MSYEPKIKVWKERRWIPTDAFNDLALDQYSRPYPGMRFGDYRALRCSLKDNTLSCWLVPLTDPRLEKIKMLEIKVTWKSGEEARYFLPKRMYTKGKRCDTESSYFILGEIVRTLSPLEVNTLAKKSCQSICVI